MKIGMASFICGTMMATFISLGVYSLNAASAQNEPSINATSLFDSGQMILSNNVKHLVILIPNEGHHGPGEEDESRFIAQPFVPQNAVVGPGTQIVWYNGDVGHEHNIVVNDNDGNADTVEYEEGFAMTGNVTVVNQESAAASTTAGTYDTVGAIMVPSPFVQNVVESMGSAGFAIDSMHTFTDLRGGQEDTGDEQVLVVWTATGKSLDEIMLRLGEVSEGLPYE